MPLWRLAVYGLVLVGALWVIFTFVSPDKPALTGEGVPMVVFITSEGDIHLRNAEQIQSGTVEIEQLRVILMDHFVAELKRPVVIIHHVFAPSGALIAVADAGRKAGAPSVTLIENVTD